MGLMQHHKSSADDDGGSASEDGRRRRKRFSTESNGGQAADDKKDDLEGKQNTNNNRVNIDQGDEDSVPLRAMPFTTGTGNGHDGGHGKHEQPFDERQKVSSVCFGTHGALTDTFPLLCLQKLSLFTTLSVPVFDTRNYTNITRRILIKNVYQDSEPETVSIFE